MATAVVMGAGGYLGRHVVCELRRLGFDVVATARRPASIDGRDAVILDLSSPYQTLKLLEHVRPAAVVDLAYVRMVELASNLQLGLQTDVIGTNAVFDACAALEIETVVYASSINVYGPRRDFGDAYITEEAHGRPDSLYGWVKQLNEACANHYASISRTRFVGLRLSGIHGRGRPPEFNPFDQMVDAARGHHDVCLPWSADSEISFLHVDDAAQIIGSILSSVSARRAIYNCAGEAITLRSLADTGQKLGATSITFATPGVEIAAASRIDSAELIAEFGIVPGGAAAWMQRELDDGRDSGNA